MSAKWTCEPLSGTTKVDRALAVALKRDKGVLDPRGEDALRMRCERGAPEVSVCNDVSHQDLVS